MKRSTTIFAAWLSALASLLILIVKFYAYFQTESQAVLSDALESVVNVAASLVALFVVNFVSSPADENHPYGHGKLEFFSSAFEGGLVAFAALAIGFTAINALLTESQVREIDAGILIMVGAGAANLALGLFLKGVAQRNASEALRASSVHVLSDVWSTIAVIVGLFLVRVTGWWWLDPVVAIILAGVLAWSGFQIVRKSIGGLMDEMEPERIQDIAQAFTKTRRPGLIDLHRVKIIRSGNFHHIDGHVVVPEFWSILQAHEAMATFEKEVLSHYRYDGEIALHMDPCARAFCSRCDLSDCAIRARPMVRRVEFEFRHLIDGPQKDET